MQRTEESALSTAQSALAEMQCAVCIGQSVVCGPQTRITVGIYFIKQHQQQQQQVAAMGNKSESAGQKKRATGEQKEHSVGRFYGILRQTGTSRRALGRAPLQPPASSSCPAADLAVFAAANS